MDTSCESSGRPTHPAGFFADESDLSERFPGHDSIDFPVAVVLPAGGSGERMGLATPKQFCTVFNRPLISYTIQAFERISWIENIVVVVAKESLHLMMDIIHKFCHKKVKVLLGGSSRHRSIFNGLQAFGEMPDGKSLRKPKVVIIHDAVRPFVEEDFLLRITIAAKEQGASGAIRPLVSTVIATTSEGYIDHSLERAKYRASEMPQGFVYDIIYQAYQQCSESDFEFGTECLHLALQYCGTNAKLIEGPPALWKVTYKKDLFAAESVIKDFLSQACVITTVCAESAELAHRFQKSLGARSMGCVYYIKQGEVCCRHFAVVVDVISGSFGNNQPLVSKTWNFIHITANIACLAEISKTVKTLHEAGQALLYPAVLILVHFSVLPHSSLTERMGQLGAIRHLAMEAKHRNILLYAILLNHNENAEQWEETVESASEITTALVKDRNPALAGQLLVA